MFEDFVELMDLCDCPSPIIANDVLSKIVPVHNGLQDII